MKNTKNEDWGFFIDIENIENTKNTEKNTENNTENQEENTIIDKCQKQKTNSNDNCIIIYRITTTIIATYTIAYVVFYVL
jgi:hypothetical protein